MIRCWITFALLACVTACVGGEIRWNSAATGGEVRGVVLPHHKQAPQSGRKAPTVVYLKNLSIPRLGRAGDDEIIARLRNGGHLVLVLDYAKHPKAVSPDLNADILKLRQDVAGKQPTLLIDQPVDVNRLFIIPEGFTLTPNIEFARDGDRVLAMDIIHPADPERPAPVLMEITCDNVSRMGSFSLLYCHDTLLEGAAVAGFAAAMVDHPVRPPYKGLDDPMSESIERMKAAVTRLREMDDELGTNGKIGAIGFSRGGPFAAILAAQGDVDAALIHGNRYDYLDLRPDDPMLARFEKAWGPRSENEQRWAEHGASKYMTKRASPMFLNTSDAESPEYRDGLKKFADRLKAAGVEHVYREDADGRGHRVTMDPKTLAKIYKFFKKHL